MRNNTLSLLCGFLFFVPVAIASSLLSAQTFVSRPAFSDGENLRFNLYFSWKFIWVKAGEAEMFVEDTLLFNTKMHKMTLLCSTNKFADPLFRMRDTLVTVLSEDMRPHYYRKAADEGGHYNLNEVRYNYLPGGRVEVWQRYLRNNKSMAVYEQELNEQAYDMMSLLAYARTVDFSSLDVGEYVIFPVADLYAVELQKLIYRGRKRVKVDDGTYYNCLYISLVRKHKGEERSVVDFYVTDDANHIPVLLNFRLNFGSAKARLVEKSGILHSCDSLSDMISKK